VASTARLRVGLVGAGYIAGFAHLPVLSRLPEARVVALCDEHVEKARRLAQRFAIPRAYSDLEEMLRREDLDLVDVCVPPHCHRDALMMVVGEGLPCLVEKPLTVTTADADAVIALAQQKGCGLYVLHTFSALPGITTAKALLTGGAIGRILGVDMKYLVPLEPRHLDPAHWCHGLPGDYFSEAGPHLAMLLVEFLGGVRRVQVLAAKLSSHPQIHLDEIRIIAEAEGGLGSITCSLNNPARRFTVDIMGTGGALHVDGNSQAVVRYGPVASSRDAWGRGLAATREILSRTTALGGTALGVLLGRYPLEIYGHRYLIQRSLRALLGQEAYPIASADAREAVRLLEMAFAQI
jgi:predicted dehydrogenase